MVTAEQRCTESEHLALAECQQHDRSHIDRRQNSDDADDLIAVFGDECVFSFDQTAMHATVVDLHSAGHRR